MLNFAGVQKTTADQLHWLDQTHQKFPQTQEGEQALLTKAITYENNAMPDEALKIYEEYLVMYPNSKFKDDVQLSIKNIGKSPEELVKEFEANRKKPN